MNKEMEEMIALGVAYALNCKFCMEYHKRKAFEVGLTEKDMHEAIQVAEGIKKGAYSHNKKNAEELFREIVEERCCPAGSECCP